MAMRRRGTRKPRKYARLRRYGFRRRLVRLRPALRVVHKFKETCLYSGTPISAPANSTTVGLMAFSLNMLANATSFKSLFDLYKITGVKVRIVPRWNTSDPLASQNGIAGLPMLYIAENRDPYVGAPANVVDVLNDDGVKIIRLDKPVTMFLKNPKAEIFDGSGNTLPFQFNSSKSYLQPWLTTGGNAQAIDQSNLNHFGYRWVLDNSLNSATTTTLDTFITLYFSMKEQD